MAREGFDKGVGLIELAAIKRGDPKEILKFANRRGANSRKPVDEHHSKRQKLEDAKVSARLHREVAKARKKKGSAVDAVTRGVSDADEDAKRKK